MAGAPHVVVERDGGLGRDGRKTRNQDQQESGSQNTPHGAHPFRPRLRGLPVDMDPAARLLAYGILDSRLLPPAGGRNGVLEIRNRLQRRDRAGLAPASVSRRMRRPP